MYSDQHSSIITTACGLCGGLGKVILTHLQPLNITFQGTCEVFFYAVISALAGYGVKLTIDKIKELSNRKRS